MHGPDTTFPLENLESIYIYIYQVKYYLCKQVLYFSQYNHIRAPFLVFFTNYSAPSHLVSISSLHQIRLLCVIIFSSQNSTLAESICNTVIWVFQRKWTNLGWFSFLINAASRVLISFLLCLTQKIFPILPKGKCKCLHEVFLGCCRILKMYTNYSERMSMLCYPLHQIYATPFPSTVWQNRFTTT